MGINRYVTCVDEVASQIIYLARSPDDANLTEKPSIAELRQFEAELIASWLKRTLESGDLKVADRQTGNVRPIEPRDVAILFRRLSNLALYESALRRAQRTPLH